MERAQIEQEIARMLAEMGVRKKRLVPAARLLQDLRIDGDDAAEFFAAVHARFGTDLTALDEDWNTHFGPEGLSVAAGAGVVMVGAAVAGTAAALADVPILLCIVLVAVGGAATWLIRSPSGTVRPFPIHLSEVADAVERGRWERSIGKGR